MAQTNSTPAAVERLRYPRWVDARARAAFRALRLEPEVKAVLQPVLDRPGFRFAWRTLIRNAGRGGVLASGSSEDVAAVFVLVAAAVGRAALPVQARARGHSLRHLGFTCDYPVFGYASKDSPRRVGAVVMDLLAQGVYGAHLYGVVGCLLGVDRLRVRDWVNRPR